MTPAWTKLRHHDLQRKLWRTNARFTAVACGRGSGKTEIARRYVVRHLPLMSTDADPPLYFYALPTFNQAKRVAWEKLKSLVPPSLLASHRGISESDLIIRTHTGSELHLLGMDKPARIEGNQWRGGVLDESSDQKPGSFDRSVRPALSYYRGWCWRIGVPKRFGPGALDYKLFYDFCAGKESGPDYEAYSWPSSSILDAKEIEEARKLLDARDFDEQYDANWQSASGAIFHAFHDYDSIDSSIAYNSDLPLCISSDFNVDPMAWVIFQMHGNDFHVFDEIWMRNTNTQLTLDHLHQRYGEHDKGFFFFGDATGRARRSSASSSDYAQIRNDKRFGKARVLYPKGNPLVVDRFASTNAQLCNASGERHIKIHPRCVHLIHDLMTRAYKEGTREPDDYGDIGHITDALGYMIHYLRPIMVMSSDTKPEISIGTF